MHVPNAYLVIRIFSLLSFWVFPISSIDSLHMWVSLLILVDPSFVLLLSCEDLSVLSFRLLFCRVWVPYFFLFLRFLTTILSVSLTNFTTLSLFPFTLLPCYTLSGPACNFNALGLLECYACLVMLKWFAHWLVFVLILAYLLLALGSCLVPLCPVLLLNIFCQNLWSNIHQN